MSAIYIKTAASWPLSMLCLLRSWLVRSLARSLVSLCFPALETLDVDDVVGVENKPTSVM